MNITLKENEWEEIRKNGKRVVEKTNSMPIDVGIYLFKLHENLTTSMMMHGSSYGIFNLYEKQRNFNHYAKDSLASYIHSSYNQHHEEINTPQKMQKEYIDTQFEDTKLYPKVAEIREDLLNFYKSRFITMKLNDDKLNSYQEALYRYISEGKQGHFSMEDIGIISTLPHSYENDMEFERVVHKCDTDKKSVMKKHEVSEVRHYSDPKRLRSTFIHAQVDIIGAYTAQTSKPRWSTVLICRDKQLETLYNIYIERSSYYEFFMDEMKKTPEMFVSANVGALESRNNHYFLNIFDCKLSKLNK